jgi:hypothetical protein
VDAVATFTFPALTVAGAATFNGNTTIGDAGTDTLTVNATATFGSTAAFNGEAAFYGNMFIGDVAADIANVNATMSFATAPVLTPGTANSVVFLNGLKTLAATSALTFNGTNFGVGTNSPNARLVVSNAGANGYEFDPANRFISSYNRVTNEWTFVVYRASGYTWNINNSIDALTLDTTGLSLGITSALLSASGRGNITLNGTSDAILSFGIGGVNSAYIYSSNSALELSAAGSRTINFTINGLERGRFDTSGNLIANASVTGHWQLPRGTTAQRPTGEAGQIRFNTSLNRYEGHNGSAWSSIGGGATGGGSDDVFYENGQTVTTNYTVTSGKNAMSAGPITISSGITVTVPSGSTWVVV